MLKNNIILVKLQGLDLQEQESYVINNKKHELRESSTLVSCARQREFINYYNNCLRYELLVTLYLKSNSILL